MACLEVRALSTTGKLSQTQCGFEKCPVSTLEAAAYNLPQQNVTGVTQESRDFCV